MQMNPFEQFSADELQTLKRELQQSGLDSFQAGAFLSAFLSAKGYGVSSDNARSAVARIESASFALPSLQAELERVAFVM